MISVTYPSFFSAGVGRTGTIILCDMCLRMAAKENLIDALYNLYKIREQRPNMVDNYEQYKLVHLVILECLFAPQTSYQCDSVLEKTIINVLENNGVEKQMKYLEETAWYDLVMKSVVDSEETPPNYPEKNRFQDIVPGINKHFFTFGGKSFMLEKKASYRGLFLV